MGRAALCLTALVLGASCAATGIGPPRDAGGSSPVHAREIDRSEFRYRWPFDTGVGTLSCQAGAVIFTSAGVTYGLNDAALKQGFPSANPILREQQLPVTNPLGRIGQGDRERIFATAIACDRAKERDPCRSRVRDQHQLSAAELEQVMLEGHERTWFPLPPRRMSLDPIVAAGLRLCE